MSNSKQLWWLSFCDGDKPRGQQFLGVAIVDLDAPAQLGDAITAAWTRGCNPGGEVGAVELPSVADQLTPAEYRNRLLTREEIEAVEAIHEAGVREGGFMVDGPVVEQVCQGCNGEPKERL